MIDDSDRADIEARKEQSSDCHEDDGSAFAFFYQKMAGSGNNPARKSDNNQPQSLIGV